MCKGAISRKEKARPGRNEGGEVWRALSRRVCACRLRALTRRFLRDSFSSRPSRETSRARVRRASGLFCKSFPSYLRKPLFPPALTRSHEFPNKNAQSIAFSAFVSGLLPYIHKNVQGRQRLAKCLEKTTPENLLHKDYGRLCEKRISKGGLWLWTGHSGFMGVWRECAAVKGAENGNAGNGQTQPDYHAE